MPKLYKCRVCDNWRYSQSSPLWKGVPWSVKLEDDYCCSQCVEDHSGPGKFESCGERGDLGKALILHSWSLDSSEDDFMSSEGWGYCGMFGRYLLFEDERGSVSWEEYPDQERTQKRFDQLYADGMGAQEDDFYVQSGRDGYEVWQSFKQIHVWAPRHTDYISERRCLAAVRLEMNRQGFYPNVWIVGERGDLQLVKGV